ncbi:MAG: AMP-binding protein, partial [Acidimicrobiia bacterium]|nr:AMP-binding protein [Acidimicrobiia bacterium]
MTATLEQPSAPSAGIGYQTVTSRVRDWALRTPDAVAMREKDYGIWQEYSWADVWDLTLDAAHGLLALGVEPGDRVSVHSEDRPEWMILDFATVAIRGITVGLYPTNPATEVHYLLSDSSSVIHFAEDQEQVDKWLERADELPRIRKVLYVEPRGIVNYDDERLLYWDDFLAIGREHRREHEGLVEQHMAEARADDVMTLVYTSGTTGPPKGAMLSNENCEYAIEKFMDASVRPDGTAPHTADEILTYLPLCHVAERIFSTWTLVAAGLKVNFAESIDTVQINLREVQPTIFFAVPRIWEKIHAGVLIKGQDATWFKRLVLKAALSAATTIGRERVRNGGDYTPKARVLNLIWRPLVFRALLDRIGLR